MVNSLILLNLAGGESVVDLDILEKDAGFCRVVREVETNGSQRAQGVGRAVAYGASSESAVGVCGVPVLGDVP